MKICHFCSVSFVYIVIESQFDCFTPLIKGNNPMLKEEKDRRGSFWATYYTTACSNLINVIKYAGGNRQAKKGRSEQDVAKIDTLDDRGNWAIEKSIAIRTLRKSSASLVEKQRVVRELESCLPFLKNLHAYCKDKLNYNPKVLDDPKCVLNEDEKKQSPDFYYSNYADLVMGFVNLLYEIRNYFAHYEHRPVEIPFVRWLEPNKGEGKQDKKDEANAESNKAPKTASFSSPRSDRTPFIIRYLGVLFDANIRSVKQRHYKNEGADDSAFIRFRRYDGLDGNKKVKPNPEFAFNFYQDGELTPAALTFIVSQFLEKADANKVLSSNGIDTKYYSIMMLLGFPNPTPDMEKRIRRVFTIHSASLPHPRVETADMMSNQTLGLDILNYLHRCPAELFDMIPPAMQEALRQESDTQDPCQDVYFKRYKSRYVHLALSSLDRLGYLDNIRFGVNMGTYYFGKHSRKVIDGTTMDDRRLTKSVYWYTRIQDAVKYYLDRQSSLYCTPEGKAKTPDVYRTEMFPQYIVEDNQVPLKITSSKVREFPHPELDETGKTAPHNLAPDAWLSTYELPIILFLCAIGDGRANTRIVKYVELWKKFISKLAQADDGELQTLLSKENNRYLEFRKDVRGEEKINIEDLPNSIRHYVLNKTIKPLYKNSQGDELTSSQTAQIWIENQIGRTQRMLDSYEKAVQRGVKLGRIQRSNYSDGRLATWLLQDIMYLQKSNKDKDDKFGKVKSSPDYCALEAFLRILSQNPGNLSSMLSAARIMDYKDFDHPFIRETIQSFNSGAFVTTKDFYMRYLQKRLEWLKSEAVLKNWADVVYPLRRLDQRNDRINCAKAANGEMEYIRGIAKKLVNEPVNLPRYLFDDLVKEAAKKANIEIPERANSTWLIMKYNSMESKSTDGQDVQGFYYWDYYFNCEPFKKLFHFLLGNPNLIRSNAQKLNEWQSKFKQFDKTQLAVIIKNALKDKAESEEKSVLMRLFHQFKETEKNIRHCIVEDISLQYAMQALLSDIPREELQLSQVQIQENDPEAIAAAPLELKPSEKRNPMLNQLVEMEQRLAVPDPEKPKSSIGQFRIYGTMKRKKYGDFLRLANDPRLPSLMRWYLKMGKQEIDDKTLKRDFEEFDRCYRLSMFRFIYDFEKKNIEKQGLKLEGNDLIDFDAIVESTGLPLAEVQILNISRNGAAHQYYPEYRVRKADENKVTPDELAKLQSELEQFNAQIIDQFKKSGGTFISAVLAQVANRFESPADRPQTAPVKPNKAKSGNRKRK